MSEGFLSRWARRKEAVRAAERSDGPVAAPAERPDTAPPDGPPDPEGAAQAVETTASGTAPDVPPDPATEDEDVLAALPSLDALTPQTDLSPFLRAGVPAALRNAALRRMWSLDPAIRDFVSEAREYAYDWNAPGGAPGFGPLLPGDDVKAMLKRVIAGSETRNAAAPEADDDGAPEAETVEPQPDTAAPVAAALPRPDGPDGPELPAAEPPEPDAGKVVVPPATPPAVRPRLRRHGGAMPA